MPAHPSSSSCCCWSRLFPFYYMVLLSLPAAGRSAAGPRRAVARAEIDLGTLRRGADVHRATAARGFLTFMPQQRAGRRSARCVLTLLVSLPGRLRGQPAAVLRPPPDQRAVPGGLSLPGDPAGDPAVRVLHPDRPARHRWSGWPIVYVAQTVAGVDLHAAELLRHDPGQPRGGGCDRRLHAGSSAMRTSACRWPCRRSSSTALFIFMIAWNEFLFALLFLVERPRPVDGLAGPVAAGRQHRGAHHRADGRLGDPDRADHRALLRQRAVADRGPDRRRREGLTSSAAAGTPAPPDLPGVASQTATSEDAPVPPPSEPEPAAAEDRPTRLYGSGAELRARAAVDTC